jgi:tetratricopeptide (TPR) repeat protein
MSWEVYRNLTYISVQTAEPKNAIEAGEQALKLNKYDSATYNNLAWVYATSEDQTLRNLERAEDYSNKAAALTKEHDPEILDTLAEVDFRRGGQANRELALRHLRQAIVLAPNGVTKYKDHLKVLFPDEKP